MRGRGTGTTSLVTLETKSGVLVVWLKCVALEKAARPIDGVIYSISEIVPELQYNTQQLWADLRVIPAVGHSSTQA